MLITGTTETLFSLFRFFPIPASSLHSVIFFPLSFLSFSVSHTQSGFREAWQVRGSKVSRLVEGWLLLSHCKPQQGRCDPGAASSCQQETFSLYPNLQIKPQSDLLAHIYLCMCTSMTWQPDFFIKKGSESSTPYWLPGHLQRNSVPKR